MCDNYSECYFEERTYITGQLIVLYKCRTCNYRQDQHDNNGVRQVNVKVIR